MFSISANSISLGRGISINFSKNKTFFEVSFGVFCLSFKTLCVIELTSHRIAFARKSKVQSSFIQNPWDYLIVYLSLSPVD